MDVRMKQDDFHILGLSPGAEPAEIKAAYRILAKQLHPDTAPDGEGFSRHLRFVLVTKAYRRLLSRSGPCMDAPALLPGPAGSQRDSAGSQRDLAYSLYRQGMDLLSRIHPSAWNGFRLAFQASIPGDTAEQEFQRAAVQELIASMPRAYALFSRVVTEYPQSIWVRDSSDKMAYLERRSALYSRIISSFTVKRRP